MSNGNLPFGILKDLVDIVEVVLKLIPQSKAFGIDFSEKCSGKQYRREMLKNLKMFLVGDDNYLYFRCEGIAIIVPISIAWHRDLLNCFRKFFDQVISINVKIDMKGGTFADSSFDNKFGKWLELNGYMESFPCSIILYGRNHVGSFCRKMYETDLIASQNPLCNIARWGLFHRVGSVVDYDVDVFYNESFQRLFDKKSQIEKKKSTRRSFSSRFWKRPAAFNKMVSRFKL